MKILSKQSFDEIRAWVYRNARQIELALWRYEFENGDMEAVLSALSHYQNADGGFGNALEPDCWNPESSPYTTLNAVNKLEYIGFSDTRHPILRGIINFFESGRHSVEYGWLFNIPSNNDYPRAPWWTYDPKANEIEHTGVTAGIICFALQYADKQSVLYKRAYTLAEIMLEKFKKPDNIGDMGLDGYCKLKETLDKLGMTERLGAGFREGALKKAVDISIVRDAAQWAKYCVRPSQFIRSPDSPYYPGNEDIVNKELDYLIDTRPENGVWDITWQWGAFPDEFSISKNWWKSDLEIGATGKLKFLKSFNRLDIN
jgi:hypothetical protein